VRKRAMKVGGLELIKREHGCGPKVTVRWTDFRGMPIASFC
jgi:hypothetical protein